MTFRKVLQKLDFSNIIWFQLEICIYHFFIAQFWLYFFDIKNVYQIVLFMKFLIINRIAKIFRLSSSSLISLKFFKEFSQVLFLLLNHLDSKFSLKIMSSISILNSLILYKLLMLIQISSIPFFLLIVKLNTK